MKRRTFVLGGGAILTISFGLTATSATLAESVSVGADFRVLDRTRTSLDATPNTENAESIHEWSVNNINIGEDVGEVIVEYPAGTSFDGLTDDEITVEFERDNGNLRDIKLEDDEYSGTTATFIVDDNQAEISGSAFVTIGEGTGGQIDGVENPAAGEYEPDLTFRTESGETFAVAASLGITSDDAEYEVTIDAAPNSVLRGETITVEYTVTNVGEGTGSQDILFVVDGAQDDDVEDLTLEEGESFEGEFDYTTGGDDGDTVEVGVESNDDAESRQVEVQGGWVLDRDPERQNQDSTHTWSTDFAVFDGEIETITITYPDRMDFEDVGEDRNEDGIIVRLEQDGDLREIEVVNGPPFSGNEATFELEDTDTTVDGEAIVIIDDIGNPNPGEYEATIELDGDDSSRETITFEV